jgi:hypothetical protein
MPHRGRAKRRGQENGSILFGLFSELAALKNEVKLEASVQGRPGPVQGDISVLQSGYGSLQVELERCRWRNRR